MSDSPQQNEEIPLFTMALKSNIILIENFTFLTFAASGYACMRSWRFSLIHFQAPISLLDEFYLLSLLALWNLARNSVKIGQHKSQKRSDPFCLPHAYFCLYTMKPFTFD
jgi:hypothetical protein